MNISRKDFLRKSLFLLGDAVNTVSDALKTPAAVSMEVRDTDELDATPREDQVAVAHNEQCLAKNCGCFSCVERCDARAIIVVMGEGIRIDEALCTGCGTCQYICPVTPKAVRMQARTTTIQTPSADQAETPPPKGESPC